MTATKNVYVLMLALVIVLSGCFGATTDDSDAQDSGTDGNNGETESSSGTQDRTWYTSGGTYDLYWNEDNVTSGGQYCTQWSNQYDVDNGSIIYTYCSDDTHHQVFSDWDTTECTDAGGVATPYPSAQGNESSYYNRYAPTCTIEFATINTSSGEALLVYQYDAISMETTCNGVTDYSGLSSSDEYVILTGSAMDCTHRLYTTISYDEQSSNEPNVQRDDMGIWSIVYAIQDVTVV
jgi:hypothetical protein